MFKIITSSTNPYIKQIVKLRKDKKYRTKEKKALIVGKKALQDVQKSQKIHTLITTKKIHARWLKARQVLVVSKEIMKKITNVKNPEDVAGVVEYSEKDIKNKEFVLILDNISDPGNMGALIRSANAFDFDLIICTKNCCDPYSDKALRAAMGSTFFIPIIILTYNEIVSFVHANKLHAYLADIKGENLEKVIFQRPFCLILSNEAKGPSAFAKKISKKVTIPIKKDIDSLNVAIAGSICMYLARK